jgi:hypothetical protein
MSLGEKQEKNNRQEKQPKEELVYAYKRPAST